jgi:energy-coupling factor transporter ATP-binding protein EcfA2
MKAVKENDALVIRDLRYRFPDGKTGLNGASLQVKHGMRAALVGKNGSGKTTLLLHINGLLDGDGYIRVSGMDRNRKNIAAIRKNVGFLFSQVEYQFIMPDLINDIMLSLPEGIAPETKRAIAAEWLRKFNLEEYASYSPLDLSSGEMKRAALAGILAGKPGILLLDEPLNNLDRENSENLIRLLKGFGTTMLIATHRLLLVEKLATHVALMEKGIVTGFFEKTEALRKKEVRELLF